MKKLTLGQDVHELEDIKCLDFSVHDAGNGMWRLALVDGWIYNSAIGVDEKIVEVYFSTPFNLVVIDVPNEVPVEAEKPQRPLYTFPNDPRRDVLPADAVA